MIEITDVASLVSFNRRRAHLRLRPRAGSKLHFDLLPPKYSSDKTQISCINTDLERPTPETCFGAATSETDAMDIEKTFWLIQSTTGCDMITMSLAATLIELNRRGFTLCHNGVRVCNIFAVNTPGMDNSGLDEPTVHVPATFLAADKPEVVGLFSSCENVSR